MAVEQLDRGRQAYARHQWAAAYASMAAAGTETPLPPDDLFRMATSASLLGRDDESDDLFAAACRGFVAVARHDRAARCAFWAATALLDRGLSARAAAWEERAHALVDARADELGEQSELGELGRAYLQLLEARRSAVAGRLDDAARSASAALETADRAGDPDLAALARLAVGASDVLRGLTSSGVAVVDEVVAAVSARGVSALTTGTVYCAAIDLSDATMDLARAREWTRVLTRWCDAQPDLVLFRGAAHLARARLLRLRGSWPEAVTEAGHALTRLGDPPGQRRAGDAWYELGEVLRLQGELDEAEQAFRSAVDHGRGPHPGHALLLLGRGRADEAADVVRHALARTVRPPDRTVPRAHRALPAHRAVPAERGVLLAERALLLAAATEILLRAGDLVGARQAAAELGRSARPGTGTMLAALADHAAGAVLLAEGRARPALEALHRAWAAWVRLDVPYEVARTRVLLARAGSAVGDDDGARLELESACQAFERLGAAPDLAAARDELRRFAPALGASGLSQRELEVLRLVALGRTNRAIAAELFVSEKTVARHLSSIFAKLDVPSRAAATVYAFEHGLV
ncbi:tetratricopeptide repeat protein [Georgenia soli]|uniref:Tetratricopeptide repeat protein n=1 Tax=Georgenia soli TaxID=638953 RepID=A0A2A9EIJ7_9MICO|nr:helix-turn-helix transcriptional regulator [Georgenia soli]PFG38082.1 tetratricopeptide repeat protein [Georgenia soli]